MTASSGIPLRIKPIGGRPAASPSKQHAVACAEPELIAAAAPDAALRLVQRDADGLTAEEATSRLKRFGPNTIARDGRPSIVGELWGTAMNPLNALLLALAVISHFLSDLLAAAVLANHRRLQARLCHPHAPRRGPP
jgi:magnesium-transporting ATPase (P-type)